MKTIYSLRTSVYSMLGLAAFTVVSCSSYQNSSYYDRDGIYGSSGEQRETGDTQATENQNYYTEYFGSIRREHEIFANADDYTSSYDTSQTTEGEYTGHSAWGSESDNITVNIYGNNWGHWNSWPYYNNWYGAGWGWNGWYGGPYWSIGWSNWYGPSWGMGWSSPYYGWGYNNWYNGFYTPYYGNHYVYQPGRRGSSYSSGVRNANGRQSNGVRSHTQYTTGKRNSGFNTTRAAAPRSTRVNQGTTRTNGNNNYSTPRTRTNSGVRTQSAPPTRVSSPSSGSRSSGGNYNSGGGRTSGGRR